MNEEAELRACDVCRGPMIEELQDYKVDMNGQDILVEDVPIWVCEQCGYSEMDDEVIEAVEEMLEHMDTVVADQENDE